MKKLFFLFFYLLFILACYSQEEIFYAEVDSNFVTLFNENATRNCCAAYEMQINQDEYHIDWIQYDTGFTCVCVCIFDLFVTFGPLNDGFYQVDVYYTSSPDAGGDTMFANTIEFEIETNQSSEFATIIDDDQSPCGGYVSIPDQSLDEKILVHPNPFTTSTTIEYILQHPETVKIIYYNQFGKQVDIIEQKQPKGLNKIVWTPKNLADGIYYFRLEAGEKVASGKAVLMN